MSLAAYSHFLKELSTAGYATSADAYPSIDPLDPWTADCAADAAHILNNSIIPLIEQDGRDIVLLMHSYASMPGIAAAKGYSKSQRALEGKKGGVVGLICMSAFLVPEGVSCAGTQGGKLPSWILLDNPVPGLNIPQDPKGILYEDVPSAVAEEQISLLKPHANLAFKSPQPPLAWSDGTFKGRLGYIVTTKDVAVPVQAQQAMMAGTEQEWIVKEIKCGHNAPFLDRISEAISHIDDMVRYFLNS